MIITLLISGMGGCKNKQSVALSHGNRYHTETFTPAFPVSGVTSLLIKKFGELPSGIALNASSPVVVNFAKNFNLPLQPDSTYSFCGFIKTDSAFRPDILTKKGIFLGPPAGDFRTVCVPLDQLEFFFLQQGILFFEADKPVYPL